MSKSAKSPAPPEESAPTPPAMPFEEGLRQLEHLVETMEAGELPLEQLLAKFEEGARLARACQSQLAAAEVRVQQLETSLGGEWTTRPAHLAGNPDQD